MSLAKELLVLKLRLWIWLKITDVIERHTRVHFVYLWRFTEVSRSHVILEGHAFLHARAAMVKVNVHLRVHEPLFIAEIWSHGWVEGSDVWQLAWLLHVWGLHLGRLIFGVKELLVRVLLLLRSFKLIKAWFSCRVHWLVSKLTLVNKREQLMIFSLHNLCHSLIEEV